MVIPRDPLGHVNDLVQQGRLPEARESLGRFLASSPSHAEALHMAGMVELMSGAHAAAVPFLSRCVELAPAVAFAWSNLGVAYNGSGDSTNALRCFQKTLELEPRNATAMKNQGVALRRLGRHDEAMASFRRAAQREPNDFELHREVGDLLVDMGRFAEALPRYDRAIAANPRDAAAHHNRGYAAWRAGDPERAVENLQRALALDANFARAHSTLGTVLGDLGLPGAASESYRRAIALDPRDPTFHVGLGIACYSLHRYDDAIAAYDRALEIDPDHVDALENRGSALHEAGRHVEALADHERVAALSPGLPYNAGHRLFEKLALCDWRGYDELAATIGAQVEEGRLASQPMALLSIPFPPGLRRRAAEMYARDVLRSVKTAKPASGGMSAGRIRVGYFSEELREHPVAQLLAPLVERHDRARFEVTAFSFGGAEPGDPLRGRLEAAFEHFEDVRALSAAQVAALARERGLDIAVDLMGHTGRARTAIFAHRAAPIQAQFLGFAGTMGADCIDYLVADAIAIPPAHRASYTESIATLPHTALVNELARPIGPQPARAALGLPAEGFVFCCFCNRTKITPDAFDVWMRLLDQVPASVLWLARAGEVAVGNLRREARARGVDPARLVFADRVPAMPDHLGRLGAADLFLDTFHYNGHVTTSDALFAGLPVLTRMGDSFASRVSASLLAALGLPELVASSTEDYAALALRLASEPETLRSLRARLAGARASSPAFDVGRLAGELERAYEAMVERHRSGLAPGHIEV